VVGGILAQYPVGWIADKTDRRNVLVGLSVASILSCLAVAWLAGAGSGTAIFIGSFVFGMTSFPIYSVSFRSNLVVLHPIAVGFQSDNFKSSIRISFFNGLQNHRGTYFL
jgi:MFS family permease